MRCPRLGANVAVFLLFFGVAALDASHDWLKALFWAAIGTVFLLADLGGEKCPPPESRPKNVGVPLSNFWAGRRDLCGSAQTGQPTSAVANRRRGPARGHCRPNGTLRDPPRPEPEVHCNPLLGRAGRRADRPGCGTTTAGPDPDD